MKEIREKEFEYYENQACYFAYAMDKEDMAKQRNIGKQLLLINILQEENDRARKGGYSFLSMDRLALWAEMTNEELDQFVNVCATLDPYSMSSEAAKKFSYYGDEDIEKEKNAYCFVLSVYLRFGDFLIEDFDLDKLNKICGEVAGSNYQRYCEKYEEYPVDGAFGTPEMLARIMRFYLQHFVSSVKEVIGLGYDWDVIAKMARSDISKERFQQIEDSITEKGT